MATQSQVKSKIFSIEGNIGSGKSILLSLIKEKIQDVQIVHEPLNNWQAIDGNLDLNLLQTFYSNPHRWGYTFQVYAYFSRLKQWQDIIREKSYIVCERSVLSDRYVFAQNGYKSGFFNELEWALYKDYFNFLVDKFNAQSFDGIIYLYTDPEICYTRLQERGRKEENSIQVSYLKDIHDRHEEWLNSDQSTSIKKIPILTIQGNVDFEKNLSRQNEILDQIAQFLKEI